VTGAFIGLLLVTTLITIGIVRSRRSKSVPSEVVGSPQFDGVVVAPDISESRDDIEGTVYNERVPPASDSGRLQSDGLDINA
jgi:hypothetical protein